ncbi:MAG: beta family protein, partial [Actinomycetota bacterium]|nr:beta family protein [Actinomycetota bacterium]
VAHSTDYHLDYNYVVNGPETPDAQEMLSVVRRVTGPDDVILFFRARAMTLYSDRRAIQGSNLDEVLPRADWYVMAKGSTYSQALLTNVQAAVFGLTKTWENSEWVLWRVLR